MSDQTPLQKLDDAIAEYVATFDPEAAVPGWILVYQTSYIQSEDDSILPLTFDQSFTMSAGTSASLGIGLMEMAKSWMMNHLNAIEDDE